MQLFSTIKEKRLPLIIESAQRMMAGKTERYHPIPAKISLEVDNIKEDTGIRSADKFEALTREEKIYCDII